MPKKAHAGRYARAVFEIALEQKELERWQDDLQKIAVALGDKDLLAALESPKIRFEAKSRFIEERLGGVGPLALNLVRLLIAKNSIAIAGAVAGEYRRLVDAYNGIQPAEVVTAVPVGAGDAEKLAERLGALVGSRVVVTPRVDPEILGGVVARVGGKLLDGSTRSRLAALKRELARGK